MGKVSAGLFVTLDGVAEAPERWNPPYFDGEMAQELGSTMSAADALLLGRVTFEEWAAFWPAQSPEENPMAALINSKKKYVVSTTLESVGWENSALVKGELATEVSKLKDQPDGNLVVSGSITLVRSLLAENLLDQIGLMIHPLVLGSGKRLLEAVNGSKNLELVASKVFSSGVVSLTYRPAADGQDAAEPERQGR